jgi:stage V sporulation protein AD
VLEDNLAGADSWEKAESEIARRNISLAVKKAGLKNSDIDYILTGDLLNQCCGSTYGIRDMGIPYFGVFGACSTMGEAMSLGAFLIDGGGAKRVIAAASSHFCSAEKQFRFPLALGTQRPQTSTWTVTGDGAVILENKTKGVKITGITTGKIVDMGITDANNMGAAMAPAAADLIESNLKDFGISSDYYDVIATGDLGYVGQALVREMLDEKGIRLGDRYIDCGIEIFDRDSQDTHSGGSGCACSAVVFAGMLYKKLQRGEIKRMLFVPTGALMSPTSVGQGESIAGIAHGVVIEGEV